MLAAVSCKLDKVALPITTPQIVVHAVLSSNADTQKVLLERTLTGAYVLPRYFNNTVTSAGLFAVDPNEPVVSDGGDPVHNATAELTLPSGQKLTAPEQVTIINPVNGSAHGAGVYQFALKGSTLVPGGLYKLRITIPGGQVVTAETTVPTITPSTVQGITDFDRDRDTLALTLPVVTGARAYEIDIDGPYEHWSAFTDSTHVRLPGTLRNLGTDLLTRVFIPGFRQTVSLAAVDANLYDYYRTTNDGFVGSGVINRVQGGLGVFGAFITISRRTYNVIAPLSASLDGVYGIIQQPGTTSIYSGAAGANTINLWVESPASRSDQTSILSASFSPIVGAAVGTLVDNKITLAFLKSQKVADTVDIFRGEVHGDSLVGKFSKGALATYVKKKL